MTYSHDFIQLWPEYSCLYDVRSPDFKNWDKREVAMSEIEEKLGQHTENSNGRHLEREALKSREQAMLFYWIIAKSDVRPKI